jgi:hypothetical protein
MEYLVAAYAIILAALLGYFLTVWLRERKAKRTLEALLESRSKQ